MEYRRQHKKKLECALYLLSQNQTEEAYKIIGTKVNKRGVLPSSDMPHEKMWKALTTAYTGLIEYIMWCQHRGQDDVKAHEGHEGENWDSH